MIKYENYLGVISISHEYFENLVGNAASNCFGVAGMSSSGAAQGFRSLFSMKDKINKGVRVRMEKDGLIIDLHIVVNLGVNIAAIVKSIVGEVTYTVENATGLTVSKVNVFVDGIKA